MHGGSSQANEQKNSADGGLLIRSRFRSLSRRVGSLPADSPWRGWIENNFIFTLRQAKESLRGALAKLRIKHSLLDHGSSEIQRREGWQARAHWLQRRAVPTGALRAYLQRRLTEG